MARKTIGSTILEAFIGRDISPNQGMNDGPYAFMQGRYGADYRTKNRLKAYRGVVYGCTSLIGEALGGEYEPYVEQKKGDKWVRVDHPFIDLINQPAGRNADAESFSKFDLFEATGIYQVLQGDAYWYVAKGKQTGQPRELILLRPDKVGVDIDKNTGNVNGYFIRREGADPIPLLKEEVLRFKMFNPSDPYKGKSAIEAGAEYIETDEQTSRYTANFFGNNAGLSGILSIKGEVTKGAFKKFVRAWRQKYEGVDNAGKVAIIRDSDAAFEKVGLGLDELDMKGLRSMSLDDVAMVLKVPLPLLGRLGEGTGLGRGNIETLEYIFAKWNIDKKMQRFDSVIEFALQRYYQLDSSSYRVRHENIIPEDKEHVLNVYDKGVDRWLTRNEVRATSESDNVKGGDQLFSTIQQIPLEDGGAPSESTSSFKSAANKGTGIFVRVKDAAKKKDNSAEVTAVQAERFRVSLMRNQLRYEKLFRRKLDPIFKEMQHDALDNLEAHASAMKTKANGQQLFDDAEYDQKMTAALQPVLKDLATTQGALALVFAGEDAADFNLTAPILSILQKNTARMASDFNDQTINDLAAMLADGIANGEGIEQLRARVEEVFQNVKGYRAERIARTETLKTSNQATLWAYRQTGYVTAKIWVVNPGACEQCSYFDGKTVGLESNFLSQGESYVLNEGQDDEQVYQNLYDDVEAPPLHPNCRCTIIPSREQA